jgi:tripartite-type tricarboxylate transporter receptor subunit TctC
MQMVMAFKSILLAAGVAVLATLPVGAQTYPSKPITLVVPFAPGGATDVLARQLQPVLQAQLGQPVVVENISGGGASIAPARVARAAPDGYTIHIHNLAISAMGSLNSKLTFDVQKDFEPIAFVVANPLILFGRANMPPNTLDELKEWMTKNTAKIANVGVGSTAHLATVVMAQAMGVKVDHIPYRGAAPAMTDLLGGQIDMFVTTPVSGHGPLKAKQVKAYGLTQKNRLEIMPDVPSLVEAFGPQMDFSFWHAVFAPAGTPKPIVDRLNAALQAAMDDPALIKTWAGQGISPYPKDQRSPAAAREILRSEVDRWAKVVRENNIKIEQ